MNEQSESENVFKPKKTPILIGVVLLVLIAAIIVLSVFLMTRRGSGKDTESTGSASTPDPSVQVNPTVPGSGDDTDATDGTTGPITPAGSGTSGSTPAISTPQSSSSTTGPSTPGTPSITTSERKYNKADPTTFSQNMDADALFRGGQVLVDELHAYRRVKNSAGGEQEFPTRTAMASMSASALLEQFGFVKVPSTPYFIRKNANLFLNQEACAEFVNMMNAFAAATGNTDVQLRNAYYYDSSEQVCYNSSGLYVDLEINKADGLYPLNYETLKSDYYDWFIANSYRYGFVHIGEQKSSTGHDEYSSFRYVGIPHATYMHNYNLDLDEYLETLKAYTIEKVLTYTDDDSVVWQIYYVPADRTGQTTIQLTAAPGSYTVSGNNTDGYIVTINTAYFK